MFQSRWGRSELSDEGFEILFRTRFGMISRFVRTKVDDAALAEDLAIEAFTLAWEKHRTGTTITVRWLLTTARNLVGNEYQRRDRMRKLLERVAMEELTNAFHGNDEEGDELRLAMSRLRPLDSLALRLTYWDELSAAEVAQFLDCTTAAVWMRLTRARATIRGLLEPRGELAASARSQGGGSVGRAK